MQVKRWSIIPAPRWLEHDHEAFRRFILKNVTVFLNQPGFAGFEAHMVAATPLGRTGQPGDIATIVAFLASADAGWMTGSLIDAAGGSR